MCFPPGQDGAVPAHAIMRLPEDTQLRRPSAGADSCDGSLTRHTGWGRASLPAGWGASDKLRQGWCTPRWALAKGSGGDCWWHQLFGAPKGRPQCVSGLRWGPAAGGCLTFPEPQARGGVSHQGGGGHEDDTGWFSPPHAERAVPPSEPATTLQQPGPGSHFSHLSRQWRPLHPSGQVGHRHGHMLSVTDSRDLPLSLPTPQGHHTPGY